MILNILGAIMCCSFVGANTLGSIETSQEVSFYQESKKLAAYDDEENFIYLSAYELNNYHFDNLDTLFFYEYDFEEYQPSTYLEIEYNQDSSEFISQHTGSDYYYFVLSNATGGFIRFNDVDRSDNKFKFYSYDEVEQVYTEQLFTADLLLMVIDEYVSYEPIKDAIVADIQANETQSMGDVLSDFISILVNGISTLAVGVASGIVDMSKSLFLTIDSGTGAITGLSVFGGLIALFAGLALAIGITTRVYLWVTSLGKD